MTPSHLVYPLANGFVHHWLLAGPYATPLASPGAAPDTVGTDRQTSRLPAEVRSPVHLDSFMLAGQTLQWQYAACGEDHFVHMVDGHGEEQRAQPHDLRAWVNTQICCTHDAPVTATLTTNGTAALWCNGQWLLPQNRTAGPAGIHRTLALPLRAGDNEILLQLDWRDDQVCPVRLALHLEEPADATGAAQIRLPTQVANVARFQAFEALLAKAYTDRDLFVGNAMVQVHWPNDVIESWPIALRLAQPPGRIYAETLTSPKPDGTTRLLPATALTSGSYQALLMPQQGEFAVAKMRIRRTLPVELLNTAHTRSTDRSHLERMNQGIQAALRRRQGLLSQVAAITLDLWPYVNRETVQESLAAVAYGRRDSARDLLALTTMLVKYGHRPLFPAWLKDQIETALMHYDDMALVEETSDDLSEAQQIVRRALQIVAGQHFPAQPFASARPGLQVCNDAEPGTRAWLLARGRYGFQTDLAGADLDEMVFALACLAALSQNQSIQELATILLDKLLFTVAINSHQGIGPGGLAGPAASIGYLMWGAGTINRHLWSFVGLADSGYTMPPLIAGIALAVAGPQWSVERHRRTATDGATTRITYRLGEGLLTSLDDGRAGQAADGRCRWQAVLGPQAVVYTNHPVHCGDDHCGDGTAPCTGFWRGDGVAPHIGQWQDALIALYHLPADDWLGFTHAHFPLHAFDEYTVQEHWAFGSCGNGYIALTASAPLILMETGRGARRELRAYGNAVSWICQIGCRAVDGSFADFQESVRLLPHTFGDRTVAYQTLRGAQLVCSWQEPLQVDGRTPLRSDPALHYDTPFCRTPFAAEQMDIGFGPDIVRLEFV